MSYITTGDIKSNLAQGFALQDYILEADAEIEDLAEALGVRDTAFIVTPLHNKVKRYGVVFILMRLCQDKMGSNDPTIDVMEKYLVQYNMYKKELAALRSEITYEMIVGAVDQIADRAVFSGWAFRS
jgi:hypothetical protein